MLSGFCLSVGLITRTEESYLLWCVVVCDLENLVNEEALAHWGAVASKNKLGFKVLNVVIPLCFIP